MERVVTGSDADAPARSPCAGRVAIVDAPAVRARIARSILGTESVPACVGEIELRAHQRAAVARLARLLTAHGGALLADAPGLGKTYVALAVAARMKSVLVVAPAALREMWYGAAVRSGLRIDFHSFETLSRGRAPPAEYELVVVDEAHHVRNPSTRRWRVLSEICARAHTLLLTATPVHNRPTELAALLALFLGRRAFELDAGALAQYTVRREADVVIDSATDRPIVQPPKRVEIASDDDVLDLLLEMPPPVPPAGGGDGGVLLLFTLVRQWASSRGALRAALRRRLAASTSLADALAAGRHPTANELRAWTCGENAVQLAFPELVASAAVGGASLLEAVRGHEAAVRHVLDRLRRMPDPDDVRAVRLEEIRAAHPGVPVVAFTQFADTVAALWRRMRSRSGVGALTARGADVAGGRLTRREALARFAPLATGVAGPPRAERIDLLLTTDLMSEGVNLQDAGVVVHLDLPWTPARLEQRVGRVARLGSRHASVCVYAFAPPSCAERLLAVERRLRDKLAVAGRTIGVSGAILPPLAPELGSVPDVLTSPVAAREAVREIARHWLDDLDDGRSEHSRPVVAAVRASDAGWLALLDRDGDEPFLVAAIGDASPVTDAQIVLRAMRMASGAPHDMPVRALEDALCALDRWRVGFAARSAVDAPVSIADRARRKALARLTDATGPRHLRGRLADLSALARRALTRPVSAGAERVLAELADAPLPIDAWLRAVAAFGDAHARDGGSPESEGHLAALILLVPES